MVDANQGRPQGPAGGGSGDGPRPPRRRFGGGGGSGGPGGGDDGGQRRGRGGPRGERPGGGAGGGRFGSRRKVDQFSADNVVPDYKDVARLKRFISDRAKIEPRRKTGVSAKTQRQLSLAIKRARHMALLPFVSGSGNR